MQAIEFTTKVKDGVIEIPKKYEPLMDLLEDISVGIAEDIRWIKDNRKHFIGKISSVNNNR